MYLSQLHVNTGDNPDRPQPGRKWLADLYRVHQRLWMAFPNGKVLAGDPFFLNAWTGPALRDPKPPRGDAGFLFRIEQDGKPRILVQSAQLPDWTYAFQNAPYLLDDKPQVRPFDPAPRLDQAYRYRLLAQVVKTRSEPRADGRTRTTRAGLTIPRRRRAQVPVRLKPIPDTLPSDADERRRVIDARWEPWRAWLTEVGGDRGFRVLEEPATPLTMQTVYALVRKPAAGQSARAEHRFNSGLFEGVLLCTDPDKLRQAIINGIGPAKAFGFGLLSIAPAIDH